MEKNTPSFNDEAGDKRGQPDKAPEAPKATSNEEKKPTHAYQIMTFHE